MREVNGLVHTFIPFEIEIQRECESTWRHIGSLPTFDCEDGEERNAHVDGRNDGALRSIVHLLSNLHSSSK